MINQTIEWKKTQSGSTEAVQFSDGMLVTAEDLSAAMRYPLAVVQVLLKAYFGCGIVCGLELSHPDEEQAAAADAAATGAAQTEAGYSAPTAKKASNGCDANFILTVGKGVALGCDGYPIEVCGPLKLDLTPDPCGDRTTRTMFVAARRITAAEASSRSCGCGASGGEPAQQCTRKRDHVLVQAFDEEHLPADICRLPDPAAQGSLGGSGQDVPQAQRGTGVAAACACLKQCGECACCGEPWVLLGSVVVGVDGLGAVDAGGARYVKPIACACLPPQADQAAQPNGSTVTSSASTNEGKPAAAAKADG